MNKINKILTGLAIFGLLAGCCTETFEDTALDTEYPEAVDRHPEDIRYLLCTDENVAESQQLISEALENYNVEDYYPDSERITWDYIWVITDSPYVAAIKYDQYYYSPSDIRVLVFSEHGEYEIDNKILLGDTIIAPTGCDRWNLGIKVEFY